MTNKTDFEREIGILIGELEKERGKLQKRLAQATEALVDVESKLTHLKETEAIYRDYHKLPQVTIGVDEQLRQTYDGLTVKEALVVFARNHGELIDASGAGHELVRAGLFKNQRNASGSIYSALKRYPRIFRKIIRGEYALTAPSEVLIRQLGIRDRTAATPLNLESIRSA